MRMPDLCESEVMFYCAIFKVISPCPVLHTKCQFHTNWNGKQFSLSYFCEFGYQTILSGSSVHELIDPRTPSRAINSITDASLPQGMDRRWKLWNAATNFFSLVLFLVYGWYVREKTPSMIAECNLNEMCPNILV